MLGDGEAERLRRLEVDDEIEPRRLLDRQVGWLGSLEDSVHVGRAAMEALGDARRVRHEAASLRELPGSETSRSTSFTSETYIEIAIPGLGATFCAPGT